MRRATAKVALAHGVVKWLGAGAPRVDCGFSVL